MKRAGACCYHSPGVIFTRLLYFINNFSDKCVCNFDNSFHHRANLSVVLFSIVAYSGGNRSSSKNLRMRGFDIPFKEKSFWSFSEGGDMIWAYIELNNFSNTSISKLSSSLNSIEIKAFFFTSFVFFLGI